MVLNTFWIFMHEIHLPGQQEDNLPFFKLILFAIIWIRVSIIVSK